MESGRKRVPSQARGPKGWDLGARSFGGPSRSSARVVAVREDRFAGSTRSSDSKKRIPLAGTNRVRRIRHQGCGSDGYGGWLTVGRRQAGIVEVATSIPNRFLPAVAR